PVVLANANCEHMRSSRVHATLRAYEPAQHFAITLAPQPPLSFSSMTRQPSSTGAHSPTRHHLCNSTPFAAAKHAPCFEMRELFTQKSTLTAPSASAARCFLCEDAARAPY